MYLKRILLTFLAAMSLVWTMPSAKAEHYSGGSITYECLGGNFFRVVLDLYLDCTGTPLTPQSLDFANDCGVVFSIANLPITLTEEVSQLCPSSLANSTCNGGVLPGIRHYRFETTVFLSPCNDWTIGWDICCRNTMQNLVATPGMYLEATVNNAGGACDASPVIADNSIPFVCVNDPVLYNPGITDPDGNTMAFELINAQYAAPAPTSVLYQGGYSGAVPIPGIVLDPVTGQLSFTPTVTGNYVVVMEVTTYNSSGVAIGTIMRDFMVIVVNCMGAPPVTTGLTNAVGGLIVGASGVEVCDGIPFCVDIPFTDADPGGSITLVSNAAALLPGATFTVVGTNPAVGTLCWTPDAAFSPANVFITATDNACPIPNVASASILITVTTPPAVPPDAGTDGSISSCAGGPAVPLFPVLGGTPDAGGVWTDPNGVAHNGSFTPPGDPFGAYVYRVGNGCQFDEAIITVNSGGGPSPGTNGTLNICATAAPVSLVNSLGGAPAAGGTWSGPSAVVGGMYNPVTMAPGAYVYTIAAVPPCPASSATVTVTEQAAPNAGTNGTLSTCSNGAAVPLINSLGGTPAAGGTWSYGGAAHGVNYNPALHAPGVYTYTVTGTAPCANATATVTVTENALPNAGTNGTLTVCSNDAAVALSTGLGGTPAAGGSWTFGGAAHGPNYNPAVDGPGVYTYTVTGTAPCANATATVTVTENALPNAGTNGTLTVCSNDAAVALSTGLGGSPAAGGSWSFGGAAHGPNYNPAVDGPGVYTYTVTGTAPCANATATVTVTENALPNAGTNGTLTVCSNDAAVALSTGLGGAPAAGGSWSFGGAAHGANYDPAVDGPGVYTYTVTGTAPCANASATVTVTENALPNGGTNGTLTVCSNDAAVALSTGLGGAPAAGGTWSFGGSAHGANYDPAVDGPGVYTYTVTGTAPCANATATVTVTENALPNAGTNGTLTVCSNDAAVALSTGLGGSPGAGGSWSFGGAAHGPNYNPAVDGPGVYTYTVLGTAPCANATATVTVTENALPNAGTNGTLTVCSNDAAVALSTGLGGSPVAGGAWTFGGVAHGVNYDPAVDGPGVYTYTVTGTAPCTNATATVTVTENALPNAGTNGTLTVCSNDAAVALSTGLGGTPAAGGSWTFGGAAHGANYDPAVDGPGVYTYTVTGAAPCVNATATVTVTENALPNAGTNGTLTVCSNDAAVALSSGLGGAPAAGGAWTFGGAAHDANYDPAVDGPGVYTYTVTGTAPCANATATVTVTENAIPNAGTNGTLTVCSNDAAVALSTGLGGTPAAGGSWTFGGAAHGANYDPAVDGPGVYTYTVTGAAPCANASATVTVTENAIPNAGTNGTLTVCSSDAAVALSTGLGGAPAAGGSWSFGAAAHGANYDPAVDGPGVYTYTVTGTAPCTNATATVTVTENAIPNAGTNGTLTVCSNDAAVALSTGLGGAPAAGGTWTFGGAAHGANYDPAADGPGVYTYTVTGAAPCANASATVTVTENAIPNAGTNGTLTVCSNDAAVALSTGLGGAPAAGGTWSFGGSAHGANYDPAVDGPGVYTYTVTGTAPCANATATVTVTENALPNAGTNGTLTVCSNDAAVALSTGLGGAPAAGGTWSFGGSAHGANYDPAVDGPGVYTYMVTGTAPCASASATVTVAENAATNAGTDGSLTVCSSGAAVALFNSLGGSPQAGGTWSFGGVAHGANYDPALDIPGVYTYTVIGTAPCANATATVTVSENGSPNAGTDGSVSVCSNGATVDLFAQLGASPDGGGTWSGPSAITGSTYDPATMDPGVYTYTIAAVAPCVGDAATVTVAENAATNAGTDGSLTVCSSGASVALFNSLGGSPQAGGTWSFGGVAHGANYDPALDIPGVYTYTVIGTAPCANATATVTVSENGSPNAGSDGSVSVCSNGATVDLFAQLGASPDGGGTWSGPSAITGSTYDPATMDPGVYTYTITAVAPCVGDAATVTVTENAATNAGTDGNLTVCSSGAAVDLFNSLGGSPQAGGTWTFGGSAHGANYDPAVDGPGVYTYTVIGTAPCTNATATVTVSENGSPNAGSDGSVSVCSNGATVDLFAQLGPSPDGGGLWSGPSAITGSTYDPATMDPGVYTYTITAVAPCVGDAATVTVAENAATNAGTDGSLTVCSSGAAVALFNSLGGSPQAGGTWSFGGVAHGANYDPALDIPGVYTYTVIGTAPCTNATATVTVSENGSPNAGSDGSVSVCSNGATVDLFAQLGASPDGGGTWSGPSAVIAGQFDPATMDAGTYTYTLDAAPPCAGSSAVVVVSIEALGDAGEDGAATVCSGAAAVELFQLLGGSPQAGGTWTGPGGPIDGSFDPGSDPEGTYTYAIAGTVCPSVTAQVIMTVGSGPDAGTGQSTSLCSDAGTVDLFDLLSGTPDAGGVWTNSAGVVVPSTFDPATAAGGDFTYSLEGSDDCPGDQAMVSIAVSIAPRSGNSGSLELCVSSAPISLFDGLTGTLDAGGVWTGPDGQAHATIINPATDGPGDYTYTVAGVPPCANASSTVTVFIVPLPDAGVDGSASLCSSADPVNLFGLLGGAPQADGVWAGPQGNSFNGTFVPATGAPGVYTYTITGIPPCGSDQSTVTVAVSMAADAGGNGSVSLCENEQGTVQLFDELAGLPDVGGAWSAPDGSLFDGGFTPGVDQPGTYLYTVQGTAPCPDVSANVMVDVVEVPVADIQVAGNEGCTPAEVVLTSAYTGGGSCTWLLWNGEVINDCGPIERTFDEAGTYDVTLVVDAGNGCGADTLVAEDLISIYEQPVADFYTLPEAVNTLDPVVQFNNTSTGGISFLWDLAGLSTSTDINPSYRFSSQFGAEYEVCLKVAASANCTDSICRTVEIEDGLTIFVPNAFTPDGSGFNDGFKPILIGVSADYYRFDIFDRWGQPLFGTDDPNAFWDGRFGDGTDVPIGVYVWKLVAKDPYSGARIERIGHVTLVR